MEDRLGWLRLGTTDGLGPSGQRKLLHRFGLPENIFSAAGPALSETVGEETARRLKTPPDAARVQRALSWLQQPGHHLVTLSDPAYPRPLLHIPDPPVMLYLRGRAALLGGLSIGIVGSRNPTPQGVVNAEAFAQHLSRAGVTVVSGLAGGIDAAAHRGALRGTGATVAVLGTGADVVYPRKNGKLSEAIARDGAIVSEFELGTPPLPANFPRRNRLISGLARGVVVVEAALGSGSLITARCAAEQGRDVFALPGSIHSPLSKGCHALIKEGAQLVECADEVLDALQWPRPAAVRRAPHAETLAGPERRFVDALGAGPATPDMLCSMLRLTPDVVSAMLSRLEIAGHVRSVPGGAYERVVT